MRTQFPAPHQHGLPPKQGEMLTKDLAGQSMPAVVWSRGRKVLHGGGEELVQHLEGLHGPGLSAWDLPPQLKSHFSLKTPKLRHHTQRRRPLRSGLMGRRALWITNQSAAEAQSFSNT